MRLRVTLLQIAVLASTGCSTSTPASVVDAGRDSSSGSGGGSSGSGGGSSGSGGGSSGGGSGTSSGTMYCPGAINGDASPAQACPIAQAAQGYTNSASPACNAFCEACCDDSGPQAFYCTVPVDYLNAYADAGGNDGDAGDADGGSDAGRCPAWSGDVIIGCQVQCIGGRGTAGVPGPAGGGAGSTGSLLAARASLEAVSVHAFARLERELAAHGAPPSLLREARRARRDEVRHTAMMTRLARRYDAVPRAVEPPAPSPVRSLFVIALENAVEGCVRETYGAVVNLVEARASRDPAVRRAMRSIAADECRHAELAWAVAAWLRARLTPEERDAVARATREGVTALAGDGDARIVGLLGARVWEAA